MAINEQVSTTGRKRLYGKLRAVVKTADCLKIALPGKHRYLYPLDSAMRRQIAHLTQPYPKRAASIQDAPDAQPGERGAAPTTALAAVSRRGG